MANAIEDLESQLDQVSEIFDSGVSGIYDAVSNELRKWQGKQEKDPSVLERLTSYWDSVGWTAWNKDTSIPWSAAFVSYVLGPDFPGASSHRKYIKNIIADDSSPWSAFSIPKNKDIISLSPGDVLIKPRAGGYGNSHGAIVWRIRDGFAELVGGNVANTAKVEDRIKVGKKGRLDESGLPYLLILKKKK